MNWMYKIILLLVLYYYLNTIWEYKTKANQIKLKSYKKFWKS